MRKSILIFFLPLFLTACVQHTNQANQKVKRSEFFHAFMKKFKPIDLPYVFRITDKGGDNTEGLKRINLNSSDTLFIHTEYNNEVYCLGYLTDTSNFYSLIFLFPADSYHPVLATYSKEGKLIYNDNLFANGCGSDCGLQYYSENAVVSKDFSISCSDTIKWEYFCDSIGEPIPNSAETWIYYKQGRVKTDGKIKLSKTKKIEIKSKP